MKKIAMVITAASLVVFSAIVQSAGKVPTTRAGWVLVNDGPSYALPFVGSNAVSMPSDIYGGLAHNGAAITCAGLSAGSPCSVQVTFAGTCQRYYGYSGSDLNQEAIATPGTIQLNGTPQNPEGATHFNCKPK